MSRLRRTWGTLFAVFCALALLTPVTVLAPIGTATAAPSTITDCATIDRSGTYVLGDDIDGTSVPFGEHCIEITASDVVLDGDGHTITGSGGDFTDGILVPSNAGTSNITVRNVRVQEWTNGIVVFDTSDVVVADVSVRRTESGATFTDVDGLRVQRTRVQEGLTELVDDAVTVDGGSNVVLDRIVARSYPDGISIAGANGTVLRNSRAINNSEQGVVVAGDPVRDVRIVNVTAKSNGDGVVLSGGRDSSDAPDERARNITLSGSRIVNNERDGVRFSGLAHRDPVVASTLRDSTIAHNGRHGVNVTVGSKDTQLRDLFVSNSLADGVLIESSDGVELRNVTSRGNGGDGLDVREAGTAVDGATVLDNQELEVSAPSTEPGLTIRDLETAVGTFDEVRIRAGGLASPHPVRYEQKAALPAILNVSEATEAVGFNLTYDEADLPSTASESTLTLYNATDATAPAEVPAQIDTVRNTVTANFTGGSGSPLAGGRVSFVALANATSVSNGTVTGLTAPGNVTRGERINVSAGVENTGDEQTAITVKYRVNGTAVRSTTVSLDAGQSRTVTFDLTENDTSSFPVGTVTQGVYTANGSATSSLVVSAAASSDPNLTVTGVDAPTNVTKGETLRANATVENNGDATTNDTITYRIDGTILASASVELGAGTSDTIQFVVPGTATGDLPVGEHTQSVTTPNDTATGPITVRASSSPGANLSVTDVSTAGNVVRGDSLTVSATVENVGGDRAASRTVSLTVSGTVHDTTTVTLPAGDSKRVALSWATGPGDAGTHTVTVESSNHSDSMSVRVLAPTTANYSVSDLRAPNSLTQKESITVNATITNVGNATGNATVSYEIAGTAYASDVVALAPGNSSTVAFTLDGTVTGTLPVGNVTHRVSAANTSATAELTIARAASTGPNVTVASLEAPTQVTRGDPLNVSTVVRNLDDDTRTITVEYRVNATSVASQTVTLSSGQSRTVTFNVTENDTSGFPAGVVTHSVYTDNDTQTAQLTVNNATPSGPTTVASGLPAPTDPDSDGRYEDINGDGRFTIVDVAEFLDVFDDQSVRSQSIFFDFNDNGQISIVDVAVLLEET